MSPTISSLFGKITQFLSDPGERDAARHPLPRCWGARSAVLVIDASPSMLEEDWKPNRLRAAQQAARAFVQRLKNERVDIFVAVVFYYKRAEISCQLTSVQEAAILDEAIDSISCDSWTNITAGLREAYRVLKDVNGTCQVVLLTDGEHNTGSEPYDIAKRLRKIATLETIGIGGSPSDVNEDLLREISSAYPDGSKRYRWIGDKERLVKEFEQLAGRLARS